MKDSLLRTSSHNLSAQRLYLFSFLFVPCFRLNVSLFLRVEFHLEDFTFVFFVFFNIFDIVQNFNMILNKMSNTVCIFSTVILVFVCWVCLFLCSFVLTKCKRKEFCFLDKSFNYQETLQREEKSPKLLTTISTPQNALTVKVISQYFFMLTNYQEQSPFPTISCS